MKLFANFMMFAKCTTIHKVIKCLNHVEQAQMYAYYESWYTNLILFTPQTLYIRSVTCVLHVYSANSVVLTMCLYIYRQT